MSDSPNGGNPDPTAGNNFAEYQSRDCPFCGETCKKLPAHLLRHCEEHQS
jgi:hypothetical protein